MNQVIFAEHTTALWGIVQALRKASVLSNVPFIGFIFKFISDFCNSINPRAFVFIVGFLAYFILVSSGQQELSQSSLIEAVKIIISSGLLHKYVASPAGF